MQNMKNEWYNALDIDTLAETNLGKRSFNLIVNDHDIQSMG